MTRSKLLTPEAKINSKLSKKINYYKSRWQDQTRKTRLLKFHISNYRRLTEKLKDEGRITPEEIKSIVLPLREVREISKFKEIEMLIPKKKEKNEKSNKIK